MRVIKMLLKAVNTILGAEEYKSGSIFHINDIEGAGLVESGAAIPVRKKITLGFVSGGEPDGLDGSIQTNLNVNVPGEDALY